NDPECAKSGSQHRGDKKHQTRFRSNYRLQRPTRHTNPNTRLLHPCNCRAWKIVRKDFLVGVTLLPHHRRTGLAHADSMASDMTFENEALAGAANVIEVAADFIPAKSSADGKPERLRFHDARFRTAEPQALSSS